MSASPNPRRLAVVVAAQNAHSSIRRCLDGMSAERRTGEVGRIILVDNSSDGTAALARTAYPDVEVIQVPGQALVPALWAIGIASARPEEAVVALTTANMAPERGWAATLLGAYASGPWAGVGGVILPGEDLGVFAAAIYWLRYHRYAAQPAVGAVHDIPGDNGSYRLEALAPYFTRIERDGFWEFEINQELVADGQRLCHTPATVRYLGGESFSGFARQRLVHGRRFGAKRIARLTSPQRWLLVAVWPLTPFAFLWRIVREARRAGRSASLLRVLPPLLVLLVCWSLGELQGYLQGEPADAVTR